MLEDLVICTLLDPRTKSFTKWPAGCDIDLAWGLNALRASWRANYKGVAPVQPPATEPSAPAVHAGDKRRASAMSCYGVTLVGDDGDDDAPVELVMVGRCGLTLS